MGEVYEVWLNNELVRLTAERNAARADADRYRKALWDLTRDPASARAWCAARDILNAQHDAEVAGR